jgi:hypothetical protein
MKISCQTRTTQKKYLLSTIVSVLVSVLTKFSANKPIAPVVGIKCERAAIEGDDVDVDLN